MRHAVLRPTSAEADTRRDVAATDAPAKVRAGVPRLLKRYSRSAEEKSLPELPRFCSPDNKKRDPTLSGHVHRAEVTGFEPAVSALTGQRVRPLHHTSTHGES